MKWRMTLGQGSRIARGEEERAVEGEEEETNTPGENEKDRGSKLLGRSVSLDALARPLGLGRLERRRDSSNLGLLNLSGPTVMHHPRPPPQRRHVISAQPH
eukprot:4378422-Pyramimonas_sp.AAC.1